MFRIAAAVAFCVGSLAAAPAHAYFESGQVDTTFGVAGTAAIATPSSQFFVHSMHVDRAGMLAVLYIANLSPTGGPIAYTVARLRHDGAADAAFGQGGKVDVTRLGGMPATSEFRADMVFTDRQGRVVLAGQDMDHAIRPTRVNPLIVGRLRPDGSADASFGTNGIVSLPLPQPTGTLACYGYVTVQGIAERPDGKLLAHGTRRYQNDFGYSDSRCMLLAQFHADGRVDADFGVGGIAEVVLTGGAALLAGKLHADGRFEATGVTGAGAFGLDPQGGYATWVTDARGRTVSSKVTPWSITGRDRLFVSAPGTYLWVRAEAGGFAAVNPFTLEVRDADGVLNPNVGAGGVLRGEIKGDNGQRFAAMTPDGGVVAVGVATELMPNSNLLTRHHLCIWRSDGRVERCGPIGPPAASTSSTSYLAPDGSLYVASNTGEIMADGTRAGLIGRFNVTAPIVEYYNTHLKHFFLTYDGIEAAWIDRGGAGEGWTRTGQSFKSGGTVPACRFFGTPGIGPPSHFFTLNPAECEWVKLDPGWSFLGMAFHAYPESQRQCPAGLRAVHRYYNNRAAQRDSNHRYVKDLSVIGDMPAQGWTYDGVVFCVKP